MTGMFEPVGDAGELPDLVVGEELGLVDEDAIELAGLGVLADAVEEVVLGVEGLGLRRDPEARADHAFAVLGVERRGEEQGAHAALAVVVGRLEQHGRFAGVHRGVGEVELGHGSNGHRRAGGGKASAARRAQKKTAAEAAVGRFGVIRQGRRKGCRDVPRGTGWGARFVALG